MNPELKKRLDAIAAALQETGASAEQTKEALQTLTASDEEVRAQLKESREAREKLEADIKDLREAVKGDALGVLQTRIEAVEKKSGIRAVSLPGVSDGNENFQFSKMILGILNQKAGVSDPWRESGYEKEVLDAAREKAMSAGEDTAGGFVVPVEALRSVIDLLRDEATTLQMGVSTINVGRAGRVEWPKQTGSTQGYWVGENEAPTTSDLALGQIVFSPRKAAARTVVSNRLIRLSEPQVEQLIRRDLARTLALLEDLAILKGAGSSSEPLGMSNHTGIIEREYATNGDQPTYAHLSGHIIDLMQNNALRGRLGFLFHPLVWHRIANQLDGNNRPLFQAEGNPPGEMFRPQSLLLGYPWMMNNQIPTNLTKGSGTNLSEVYFANWADTLLARWGNVVVKASQETSDAFAKDQTHILIMEEVDVGMLQEKSLSFANDVKTTA